MLFSDDVSKNITASDRKIYLLVHFLLEDIWGLADRYPSQHPPTFRCHSICRALVWSCPGKGLTCVDGNYTSLYQNPEGEWGTIVAAHSWLVTPDGSILDPYPSGVGIFSLGPLLYVNSGGYEKFSQGQYVADPEVTRLVATRRVWREAQIIHNYLMSAVKARK